MSITDSLKVALSELACVRHMLADAKSDLSEKRAEFEARASLEIQSVKTLTDMLAQSETQTRMLTLAAYELDPTTTKPVEGVSVVMNVAYEYDAADAMAWVKTSAPHLLIESYDVASVKKAAQAGLLPFAKRVEVPAVRIASDLSEYAAIPEPEPTHE